MRRFPTIADGLARSDDNFLLLRFLASLLVIYGHAPIIGGHETQDLFLRLNWGRYSGAIAVDLFFVISGFLVSASWLRQPHFTRFLRARALRIVPAYAACILGCVLVIGPLFTTLLPRDYFSNAQTWDYALANLHFGPRLVWWLPGVFSDHAVAVVNGSIWTLPVEVFLYACVAMAGILGILARRVVLTALLALTSVVVVLFFEPTIKPIVAEYLHMAGLFALGSVCYVWRERIPNHGAVLLILAALAWVTRDAPVYPYLFALAEVAFVFWFAYKLGGAPSRLRGFNRLGDYSYGLYLWGYPAQQIVVAVAGPRSVLIDTICGFGLALLLAIASWHIIEQPALRLKAFPRRR